MAVVVQRAKLSGKLRENRRNECRGQSDDERRVDQRIESAVNR